VISSVVRSAGAKLALDFITAPFPHKTHFNFRFGNFVREHFARKNFPKSEKERCDFKNF